MIKALSCHSIPTTNHPIVPHTLNHKSNIGKVPVALQATASKIKIDAIHFTYHERSYLGVFDLNMRVVLSCSSSEKTVGMRSQNIFLRRVVIVLIYFIRVV